MSAISNLFTVKPTETADKVSVVAVDLAAALPSGYTAITPIKISDQQYLCAYNSATGNTDLYSTPGLTPVDSRIDLSSGPWEMLTSFILGNETYLLTYRAQDGMFGFYHVSADLSASPPYLFYFSRNTPTVGFTEIAAVSSLGTQYVLGYNFEDGTVAAFSVSVVTSSSSGIPPLNALNVWYHRWAKGWTRFAFFKLGGANFFFKINTDKLNVNIDHLNDAPGAGTVEVGSFLQSQMPNALSVSNSAILPWINGDPHLLTYVASKGETFVYRIHGDCLGWTQVATLTTVASASLVVPYAVGTTTYVLFYGAEA
jgi:hypothetical protein